MNYMMTMNNFVSEQHLYNHALFFYCIKCGTRVYDIILPLCVTSLISFIELCPPNELTSLTNQGK
jgi:hypothetical protein